jgi:RecQ-mediated genome instability protein 1
VISFSPHLGGRETENPAKTKNPLKREATMRRNLRVVVSDDEVDDDPPAGPTVSPDGFPSSSPPIPPTNANPSHITPPNISDEDLDDFVTVPDDLSTPSPPALSTPSTPVVFTYNTQNANSNPRIMSIYQLLRRLGLCISHEWLEACSERMSGTVHGYDGLDDGTRAKKIFEQFLFADLNECGAGVLPGNVGMMHKAELDGPFVLQVRSVLFW